MKTPIKLFITFSICLSAASEAVAAPATRVASVKVFDQGSVSAASFDVSIDVQQGVCGAADDQEPEPFYDSLLTATIHNRGVTGARIVKYWYRLPSKGAFKAVRSRALAASTDALIPPLASADVNFLFLKALEGGKLPYGSSISVPTDYGFKSITFYFQLRDGLGKRSIRKTRIGLAFGNYDRCA